MTQHPEEGTLHAYIDGELSPAESATLELHVGECARCAAALAEARGYAAAASRVITALDAAPSAATVGTPVVRAASAPARRAARPQIFRLPYARAAALLLVVGGTVLVADRTGTFVRRGSPAESSMTDAASGSDLAPTATAEAPSVSAEDLSTGSGGGISDNVTPEAVATAGVSARRATDGARRMRSTERSVPSSEPPPARVEQRGVAGDKATGDAAFAAAQTPALAGKEAAPMAGKAAALPTAPPLPPASAAMRLEEVVVTGALSVGPTVSRYRTRDGKILTLTEEPLRASFAAESASAARRETRSMAQSAAAPMLALAVNSFRWTNVELGRAYTLSGPMTVAELEAAARRLGELERLP